jgi:hypothetical protein
VVIVNQKRTPQDLQDMKVMTNTLEERHPTNHQQRKEELDLETGETLILQPMMLNGTHLLPLHHLPQEDGEMKVKLKSLLLQLKLLHGEMTKKLNLTNPTKKILRIKMTLKRNHLNLLGMMKDMER